MPLLHKKTFQGIYHPFFIQATDANPVWTPQQDLGDSSSDGAGVGMQLHPQGIGVATYSPGAQPFSLSLPRENQDKVRGMGVDYAGR